MQHRILCVFFRSLQATQMDQVSWAIVPQAFATAGPRGVWVVCLPDRWGEGAERKSGFRQDKDEAGFNMTSVPLITRFSRQCLCSWWKEPKEWTWLVMGIGSVCMCVSSVFRLWIHYCPIPHSFCHSWVWPCTISPSGSYICDRYRERKALCRKQICQRAN